MNHFIMKSMALSTVLSHTLFATMLSPEEINDLAIESGYPFVNIGVTGGSLGVGVNLSKHINDFFSLRFNMNGIKYGLEDHSLYHSNIDTDKTYHLDTKGLLLDLHLKQLRFTVGAYINNNSIDYVSRTNIQDPMIINKKPYGPEAFTEIHSRVSFNKISPYIGVGWGNNSHEEGWSFTFDVGLMYHGNPSIEIDATMNSNLSATEQSIIREDMKSERKFQEKDLADFPFYPVVMVGISYSF